ncbi:MAG: hypothetical protein WCA26_01290 [Xanthobacteraceae bacterium]
MLSTLAALLATLTGFIIRRLVLLIALAGLAALLLAALLATLVLLLISILVAHRRCILNAPQSGETNRWRARSSFLLNK